MASCISVSHHLRIYYIYTVTTLAQMEATEGRKELDQGYKVNKRSQRINKAVEVEVDPVIG